MKLPSVRTLPAIELDTAASGAAEAVEPATVEEIAAASPALLDAAMLRARREPRVRLTISHLPVSYKKAFQAKARELGLTDKGLLIEMMRRFGFDVVPADRIDGRVGPGRGALVRPADPK